MANPGPRDQLLKINAQDLLFLDRLDRKVVREISRAYQAARLEILGAITERQATLKMPGLDAEQKRLVIQDLARDQSLFAQIELRLMALQGQVGRIASGAFDEAYDGATDRAKDEALIFARYFDLQFTMVDFTSVEIGLQDALAALSADQGKLGAVLISELRGGLIRGDPFDDIVRRLLAKDSSVFVNGEVSAVRAARRGVIEANNGARDLYYREWEQSIPGLMKQAVAAITPETTDTCLAVHGQIRRLNEPYELTGRKAFQPRMMYPGFHWNCRTSSVAYHPKFEEGSAMTTEGMREAARKEAERRKAEV